MRDWIPASLPKPIAGDLLIVDRVNNRALCWLDGISPYESGIAGSVWLAGCLGCFAFVVVAAQAAATLPPAVAEHPRISLYFVSIGAAFLCYLVGLLALRRRTAKVALVLAAAVLIQVAPLVRPLLLSGDAFVYWDYSRVAAIDGGNPYRDPPGRFPSDPAYQTVSGAWHNTTSVYGPLFTLASEGGALAVGTSVSAASAFYKSLAAVCTLVLAGLAAALSSRPGFAAAAVGWNPLLAIHFAGGGHNDMLMMVPLLGALLLEKRGRRQSGGVLWALAAGIKWIPLLLLPLRIADRRSSRRFGYVGFGVAATLTAAVASALYGSAWLKVFQPLRHDLGTGSKTSVAHLLRLFGLPRTDLTWLLVIGFVIAYVALLRAARGRGARLGLIMVVLLVATPWILPWYASWALPLAAAEDDSTALGLSLVLTGYLLEARAPI